MLTKSPFLTGFPTRLFGSARKSAQEKLQQHHQRLHEELPGSICCELAEELPPELIRKYASTQRNRVYSHEVTFWAFLAQILSEDGSCAGAVAQAQQWFRERGHPVPSADTNSYVQARMRLPEDMIANIHHAVSTQLEQHTASENLWRGHQIKAIDGTSAQMPDTAPNQQKYPQPSKQAPGCGFPVVQLVGLINLIHGGWEDFVESDMSVGETKGLHKLMSYLGEGDVLVADRAFVSYEITAGIMKAGAHLIGRCHHSRKIDFRKGTKLGPNECLQTWSKPNWQTPGSCLTQEQWEQLPEQLDVRIIRQKWTGRDGKRTTKYLFTTLLDAAQYPVEEIASLYFHRWEIEVRFRDIKTTMGMEMLRTKSPRMIRKELMMHMVAYNILRLLMLKSGQAHGCNARRLSFKGAKQALSVCTSTPVPASKKPKVRRVAKDHLLERIAERRLKDRPGRSEPRKVKRRPKSSRWLQQERTQDPGHFTLSNPPMKILDQPA